MSDQSHARDPEPPVTTVLSAQRGDARALEALVVAARDRVYRLSLRMTARPADADAAILEREVQLACTHAMLTCLDRDDRIAYILGDIFGVDSEEGGYICEISAATYRKRLSRARGRVRHFLSSNCGLVSHAAACRCANRVDVAVRVGRIDPQHLQFTDSTPTVTDELVRLHDAANLLRSLPDAKIPEGSVQTIKKLIQNSVAIGDPVD